VWGALKEKLVEKCLTHQTNKKKNGKNCRKKNDGRNTLSMQLVIENNGEHVHKY
jgi:hypothetical protein